MDGCVMKPSDWLGIKQVRAAFGLRTVPDELIINLNLALMGTSERVQQLVAVKNELQQRIKEAAEAYQVKLRGS